VPIDQVNNFFGIDTPQDVKLKSRLMFEKNEQKNDEKVLTEEEMFDKATHKFFGIEEPKGPCIVFYFL